MIFLADLPDNCQWSPWGDCSVTCGMGTRWRFRYSSCEGLEDASESDKKPCDNPICYGKYHNALTHLSRMEFPIPINWTNPFRI